MHINSCHCCITVYLGNSPSLLHSNKNNTIKVLTWYRDASTVELNTVLYEALSPYYQRKTVTSLATYWLVETFPQADGESYGLEAAFYCRVLEILKRRLRATIQQIFFNSTNNRWDPISIVDYVRGYGFRPNADYIDAQQRRDLAGGVISYVVRRAIGLSTEGRTLSTGHYLTGLRARQRQRYEEEVRKFADRLAEDTRS